MRVLKRPSARVHTSLWPVLVQCKVKSGMKRWSRGWGGVDMEGGTPAVCPEAVGVCQSLSIPESLRHLTLLISNKAAGCLQGVTCGVSGCALAGVFTRNAAEFHSHSSLSAQDSLRSLPSLCFQEVSVSCSGSHRGLAAVHKHDSEREPHPQGCPIIQTSRWSPLEGSPWASC